MDINNEYYEYLIVEPMSTPMFFVQQIIDTALRVGYNSHMDSIIDILSRHKEKLLNKKAGYMSSLNSLPKGSLTVKTNGGREYWYLKYREGKKVITKYVGKLSESVISLQKQIDYRKKLEKSLKELEKELELISRFESIDKGV